MKEDEIRSAQGARLTAARMSAGYRSARAAAIENHWPESTYRAHEGGTRTIGQDDAERYARLFRLKGAQVSAERILFGTEREQAAFVLSPENDAGDTPLPPGDRQPQVVRASYGGLVEAGAFRPVADYEDDPDRELLFYPRDPQFPQAGLFVFDVAGDSMNALQPRPILPGDRLLCIDIERARIPLRDKMVVIVEQSINGGLLRERSVKQVEDYDDRYEFCPRSKSPRHKPIVVPKDFKVDDGRTVAVIAIVRDIINRVPLG